MDKQALLRFIVEAIQEEYGEEQLGQMSDDQIRVRIRKILTMTPSEMAAWLHLRGWKASPGSVAGTINFARPLDS